MVTRPLLGALAVLAVLVPSAAAQDVSPLAGTGDNVQPIARVNIPRINEIEIAGDWVFVSRDQHEEGEGGLVIVNVADPTHPFIEGHWDADKDGGLTDFSSGDVDLSPDGNLAVLTNAHCGTCAEGEVVWDAIIDTSDKAHPKMVGKIVDDGTTDYIHTSTLDNNGKTLYTNPQVAAFYPQAGNAHITVWDISDPTKPVKKGVIEPPAADLGLAHDTYVDHRPDGKALMYAASIHKTDVIDITEVGQPTWLQSVTGEYTISHDVQPNHDRTILIVDDEGALGGQLDENVSVCGRVGAGPATLDSGSVHFYPAAADGTFANEGLVPLGTFNAPLNYNTGACVAHVFWQAPNENRLTQAYYRTGAFVIDFEDPASPKQLAWFVAEGGAEYWSNKPHRGYMFASDMEHGLDILKYTGEGGSRWPATAGPAEIQRSARQGTPYVPIAGAKTGALPGPSAASARRVGDFAFTARLKKVPGKKGKTKLTLAFATKAGKGAGRVTFKRAAGKKTTVKVTGVAVPGSYRWALRSGSKVLKRGTFKVRAKNGLKLSPGARLAATVK